MRRDLFNGLGVLTVVALCSSFAASADRIEQTSRQSQGSLYDEAKNNGGHLIKKFEGDRSVICGSLTELAKRSPVIVIGRIETHRQHLTADGTSVTTDCSLTAQEVLKGDPRTGKVISVSLPGGGHRYSDGITAVLYPTNFRPAQIGKTYLFFLQEKTKGSSVYELALGIQGQFELDFAKGTVMPADVVPIDPLVKKYRDKRITDFLVDLHKAVGQKK